ncbi:MAG: outer membrane beta-barrel protein, partial [Alphaproteobacteria bacterium]|nr:outer membrane beta-barrel protein [Alphaproteobacteria bacterium]
FLPGGLQLTAGQFYSPFGRKNAVHVHAQDFADQPFVISRMFGGDGQRQVGMNLSWLTPLPWYSELSFAAQNSNGETMPSFGGEDEGVAEFENVITQNRNFSDLVYTGRWLNGFDLTDTLSMNIGASISHGPNRTGPGNRTTIYGADLYAKWVAPNAVRGFPFVSFESEVIARRYEAGDVTNNARVDLEDWGLYAQALYGFDPGWVAGLRFGFADGDRGSNNDVVNSTDLNRAKRYRISPNLTWYPTEWSKIRLQYNHDWSEALPGSGLSAGADPITGTYGRHSAESVWLQLGIALGSHGAHKF